MTHPGRLSHDESSAHYRSVVIRSLPFHVKHLIRSCALRHDMAKSVCVRPQSGGRRCLESDSLTCVSTPPLAALPIRRLTPRDLTACADLSEDRGWPREEHKWRLLLTAGTGYGIDDPDGGLAAACVVTEYGSGERPDLGAIGMVLVAARHARQGVGRRLMRHIVSAMGTT